MADQRAPDMMHCPWGELLVQKTRLLLNVILNKDSLMSSFHYILLESEEVKNM